MYFDNQSQEQLSFLGCARNDTLRCVAVLVDSKTYGFINQTSSESNIFVFKIARLMVLEVPDQVLFQAKYTAEAFKLDIAVMLYQKKVMSLARAAEWVSMSRIDFQKELKSRGVHLHHEISDLHEELAAFEKIGL